MNELQLSTVTQMNITHMLRKKSQTKKSILYFSIYIEWEKCEKSKWYLTLVGSGLKGAQKGLLICWFCSFSWTQHWLHNCVHFVKNHQSVELWFYTFLYLHCLTNKAFTETIFIDCISPSSYWCCKRHSREGKIDVVSERKILLEQCPWIDERRWKF